MEDYNTTYPDNYDPTELREAIIELSENGPLDWKMSPTELTNLLFCIGL